MKSILKDKHITVAVTGGIAAYKAPILVRRLKDKGANVQVVMTESAKQFVTPLTLETVSNNPVIDSLFKEGSNVNVEHIAIADQTDLLIIAPTTANTIGKIASGIGDDFLTAMVLAYTKKVLFVPSMNVNMYANPIVQKNMKFLNAFKDYQFMDATEGDLACGYSGKGRMPEPEDIVREAEFLLHEQPLLGKKILITAGATKEYLDPVRFISNPSTGKMGYALAEMASFMGAEVTLLSHACALTKPHRVRVETFTDVNSLKTLIYHYINHHDLLIMSAAVGDIKIKKYSEKKMKKTGEEWKLEFASTTDILASIKDHAILKVGFAAESHEHLENAQKKLAKKGLDMIVLNDISRADIGFESNHNQVTLITKEQITQLEKLSKKETAFEILKAATSLFL